jgi:hypothetical protein
MQEAAFSSVQGQIDIVAIPSLLGSLAVARACLLSECFMLLVCFAGKCRQVQPCVQQAGTKQELRTVPLHCMRCLVIALLCCVRQGLAVAGLLSMLAICRRHCLGAE